MRLYTLTGAAQVADPEFGSFTADVNGAFDFPEELSDRLHGFHLGGKPAWETDAERVARVAAEELEKFRDPATLLAEVRRMGESQGAIAAVLAKVLGLAPAQAAAAEAPAETAAADPAPGDTPPAEAPAKTARSRKTAAATTAPAA
jgi:hypothetical protein